MSEWTADHYPEEWLPQVVFDWLLVDHETRAVEVLTMIEHPYIDQFDKPSIAWTVTLSETGSFEGDTYRHVEHVGSGYSLREAVDAALTLASRTT